jgi:hypothetical protein
MYSKDEINKLFKSKSQFKRVIVKDHNYKVTFVEELNNIFQTSIIPEEYDGELDLPPDKNEIFNNHIKKRDYESE